MSERPNNKQIFDSNTLMLEDQDRVLDEILIEVEQSKGVNREISQETEKQEVLTEDMKKGLDRVDSRMRTVNDKIKDLLKQVSFCSLYMAILALLVVMLLLLFLSK